MRTDLNPDSYGGSDPDLVFFEGVDSDQDTVRPFKICMVFFFISKAQLLDQTNYAI